MPTSKLSLFAQLLALIDRAEFKRVVAQHGTDKYAKGLDTWTHFVSMLFSQLSGVSSLRDITNSLRSATSNLNHMNVQRAPRKSAISYQNKHRNYKV